MADNTLQLIKEGEIREVNEGWTYSIYENKQYQLRLIKTTRSLGGTTAVTEAEVTHLYRVTLSNGYDVYVLASSGEDAISQATSGETWDVAKNLETGATVTQVPFRIRGWSNTRF